VVHGVPPAKEVAVWIVGSCGYNRAFNLSSKPSRRTVSGA